MGARQRRAKSRGKVKVALLKGERGRRKKIESARVYSYVRARARVRYVYIGKDGRDKSEERN